MKKSLVLSGICTIVLIALVWGLKTNASSAQLLEDTEAVTACESIGWWDNDGNCVENNRGDYFCKTDDIFHFTDCIH